ncbi:MAG: hydratase [Christensenellaceae bacterium]|jgi:aconitate hydratase
MKLFDHGVYLLNGREIVSSPEEVAQKTGKQITKETAKKHTIAYGIIEKHNTVEDMQNLRLMFDSLTSHDITYVGIIQTARASGMETFPMPYVLTNCHNSLCAVGGTINEDDHKFALSAAKKYGGIYVPTNMAVIHSYNREMMAGCGKMILGSDSHTRYGALGTMAVGEGGGELAKQLVGRTYDLAMPEVVGVYLTGKPQPGVGAHDVALSIVGAVYENGYTKNKVMEFIGDGIANLPVEYRNGIDVMTTETTCWSSIWETDDAVKEYLALHGRSGDYAPLMPGEVAYYDGMIYIDLAKIKPTIAMPFHPSYTYTIEGFLENAEDILYEVEQAGLQQFAGRDITFDLRSKLRDGAFYVDQGIVAGCSGGTFDTICDVADILVHRSMGNDVFSMSVYPGSQPTYLELVKNGSIAKLMEAGVIVRECFCGPCFGAGDTPANGEFSIRHTTRNFPNREGSQPGDGQLASVALMDAHSIAATAINGGKLTAATDLAMDYTNPPYHFDSGIYGKRVYNGFGKPAPSLPLQMGPNIKDWPHMPKLTEHLLLKVTSYITDPVTTTDELIPSGETSSYRSNPLRLAEFTLSRKDPAYVGRAKAVHALEVGREEGSDILAESKELAEIYAQIKTLPGFAAIDANEIIFGSTIFANKPGDGSAREQAASCQRVLGGAANLALEYATKRYRSNLINWGMIPFLTTDAETFEVDDYIFVPYVTEMIQSGESMTAYVVGKEDILPIQLTIDDLTQDEKQIILEGSLINYYKNS